MSRYEGIVVGGPYSGQRHVCQHPRVRLTMRPPTAVSPRPQGKVPREVRINYLHFRHVWLADMGFWIPDDKDECWLIEQLAKSYMETEKDA